MTSRKMLDVSQKGIICTLHIPSRSCSATVDLLILKLESIGPLMDLKHDDSAWQDSLVTNEADTTESILGG